MLTAFLSRALHKLSATCFGGTRQASLWGSEQRVSAQLLPVAESHLRRILSPETGTPVPGQNSLLAPSLARNAQARGRRRGSSGRGPSAAQLLG